MRLFFSGGGRGQITSLLRRRLRENLELIISWRTDLHHYCLPLRHGPYVWFFFRSCSLEDVGIGTGTALLRNADLIKDKKIVVRGVDYDWSYILTCREEVQAMDLQNAIHVVHESIYDYRPAPSDDVQSFDAVYFSGSFMILPDKALALKRVIALLKDQQLGSIFFTQTFEQKKNPYATASNSCTIYD